MDDLQCPSDQTLDRSSDATPTVAAEPETGELSRYIADLPTETTR